MIALVVKRRWWSLAALSLVASAAYEAVWMASSAGPEMIPIQANTLVLFAGVFAAIPAFAIDGAKEATEAPLARFTRYAALVVPFGFAARLVLDPGGLPHAAPLVGVLVALTVTAAAVARARREAGLPFAAVIGDVVVVAAWLLRADTSAQALSFAALGLLPLAPVAALTVLETRRPPRGVDPSAKNPVREAAMASAVMLVASVALLVFTAAFTSPGAWLAYDAMLVGLGLALLALSRAAREPVLAPLAVVSIVLGLCVMATARSVDLSDPSLELGLATDGDRGGGARARRQPRA